VRATILWEVLRNVSWSMSLAPLLPEVSPYVRTLTEGEVETAYRSPSVNNPHIHQLTRRLVRLVSQGTQLYRNVSREPPELSDKRRPPRQEDEIDTDPASLPRKCCCQCN